MKSIKRERGREEEEEEEEEEEKEEEEEEEKEDERRKMGKEACLLCSSRNKPMLLVHIVAQFLLGSVQFLLHFF